MIGRMACDRARWWAGCRALIVIAVLIGAGLLLTGCGTSLARTPRMSEVWSKGLPLGMASLNNRVALTVSQTGQVYAVWVDLERDLRFVYLNERASVQEDLALDLDVTRPHQPQMVLDAGGQLHLAWLDRQGEDRLVFYARFRPDGLVLQGATVLSSPDARASRLALALDPVSQGVHAFWSDNVPSRPGIYHAAWDRSGTVITAHELLVADGLDPAVQADDQGFVHFAWRTEREGERVKFHYAVYDPQSRALGPILEVGEPVAEASLIGGPTAAASFDGPHMGLDENLVYLAWTMEVRERGQLSAFTFYQTIAQPALSRSEGDLFDYLLPEEISDPIHVRGRDPSLTGDPRFVAGYQPAQVLACYTQAQGPRNLEMLQSATVRLPAGQVGDLEVASATTGASLKPVVAGDGQGYLHLVWIDTAGFDRYRVLYASTAPQVHEVLDPATVGEVLSQTLELGFGALTLIGFLPLYLMWAVPAFLVILVFYLATHEADLDQRRAAIALWVTILIHAIVKVMTASGALQRLSSGLLLTTPGLVLVVSWVGPLLISGLAVLVMRLYVRRTGTQSI
ncbi:MAG: hypothetical protein PVJ34_11975, partial [Anaerolineae bacterium]